MKIESGTIVEPYMLQISNPDRLVTIRQDGTVEVHKEGADKEAAKLFYEALQIEGKTLHDHIAALKAENEELRADLVTAESVASDYFAIMTNQSKRAEKAEQKYAALREVVNYMVDRGAHYLAEHQSAIDAAKGSQP